MNARLITESGWFFTGVDEVIVALVQTALSTVELYLPILFWEI
jgi:hypothetical protein